ncbi:uncharacterized protein BDW43DRAFT_316252 [Aspergillus alliaceus]|uniref:uncharacterized protein n=1 Tax=Petromyces alliaceus TaxID=209559 RepID=UPI0012A46373|nr:uncharacterized protein BDW43DRAFT_316252 [Aspergillus alliaceus]KAB8228045.1 hypothetical protein BDW43DRAFT_316252 [Aspergillus alliaceus]
MKDIWIAFVTAPLLGLAAALPQNEEQSLQKTPSELLGDAVRQLDTNCQNEFVAALNELRGTTQNDYFAQTLSKVNDRLTNSCKTQLRETLEGLPLRNKAPWVEEPFLWIACEQDPDGEACLGTAKWCESDQGGKKLYGTEDNCLNSRQPRP